MEIGTLVIMLEVQLVAIDSTVAFRTVLPLQTIAEVTLEQAEQHLLNTKEANPSLKIYCEWTQTKGKIEDRRIL